MESKINEIDKKINKLVEKTKEINNNTLTLNEKLEQVNKDLENLKKAIETRDQNIKKINESNNFLLAENKYLKETVTELRMTTENIWYQQHSNELDLIGIKDKNSQDILNCIIYASKKWKVNISESDILNIEHQNLSNKNDKYFRITFKTQKSRDEFYESARKSRQKENDLNLPIKNKIYFNEVLPKFTKQLFYHARQLKKKQKWKYVWCRNGKIYIRKEDKTPAILLKSIEEIEKLIS